MPFFQWPEVSLKELPMVKIIVVFHAAGCDKQSL